MTSRRKNWAEHVALMGDKRVAYSVDMRERVLLEGLGIDGNKILKLMLMKIQPDATVCRYLFTAKLLYMFRVSQHPSSGVLKSVTAASGTRHNIGTATSLQRGHVRRGHVGGR